MSTFENGFTCDTCRQGYTVTFRPKMTRSEAEEAVRAAHDKVSPNCLDKRVEMYGDLTWLAHPGEVVPEAKQLEELPLGFHQTGAMSEHRCVFKLVECQGGREDVFQCVLCSKNEKFACMPNIRRNFLYTEGLLLQMLNLL